MNRERLKTLRDHLAGLPDERVDMSVHQVTRDCHTVACIAGWADFLFGGEEGRSLGFSEDQSAEVFFPAGWVSRSFTRLDAIAAIDSMLANPADDALPVWPKPPTQSEGAGK